MPTATPARAFKCAPTPQVKSRLRGEPDTKVAIDIQRDGSTEKVLHLDVPRKLVRLPDVTLATLAKPGAGYIKLDGFSEGTPRELATALLQLQAKERLSSLTLDLRDNPGGLLDSAVAVSQQLVPEGTDIVSTAGR